MSIHINPGTSPVIGAIEHADSNMDVFAADLRDASLNPTNIARNPADDGDGWYGYTFNIGPRVIGLKMPGLPLDQVRYMESEGQDIWDFPRLYVDDSSWIWMFAIRACEPIPIDVEDDDETPTPPLGDQILADTTLSDTEAFTAAGEAYAADRAATADEQPAPGS